MRLILILLFIFIYSGVLAVTNVELNGTLKLQDLPKHVEIANAIIKEKSQVNIRITSRGGALAVYEIYQYALDRTTAQVHMQVHRAHSAAALLLCQADTIEFTSTEPVVFHALQIKSPNGTSKMWEKGKEHSKYLFNTLCKPILSPSQVDYMLSGNDLGVPPKVLVKAINGRSRVRDLCRPMLEVNIDGNRCTTSAQTTRALNNQ